MKKKKIIFSKIVAVQALRFCAEGKKRSVRDRYTGVKACLAIQLICDTGRNSMNLLNFV